MKKYKIFLVLVLAISILPFIYSEYEYPSPVKGDGWCQDGFQQGSISATWESWWDEPGKTNALDNPLTPEIDDCLPTPAACCVYENCSALSTDDVEYYCQPDDVSPEEEQVNTMCYCYNYYEAPYSIPVCEGIKNCKEYPVGGGSGASCPERWSFGCSTMARIIYPLDGTALYDDSGFFNLGCEQSSSCWIKSKDKMMQKYIDYENAQMEQSNKYYQCDYDCMDQCYPEGEYDEQQHQQCLNDCYNSCLSTIEEVETPTYEIVNLEEKCVPRGDAILVGESNSMYRYKPVGFCSLEVASCNEENRTFYSKDKIFQTGWFYPARYSHPGVEYEFTPIHSIVKSRQECFCPFEYIGTTIRVDPLVFRKKYCREEGCVLDYGEYVQPEKVDFERKFNPDAGEYIEFGPIFDEEGNFVDMNFTRAGAMEEIGGKMRTIVVPGDSIECIAEFTLDKGMCLDEEETPTARIKLGWVGEKEAKCYEGRITFKSKISETSTIKIEGYKLPPEQGGEGTYVTLDGRTFTYSDRNIYWDKPSPRGGFEGFELDESVVSGSISVSNNWFCPASFITDNSHRGTNHSCEVKSIDVGGIKIEREKQYNKEKYVTEDIVIAKHVFVFLGTRYAFHKAYLEGITFRNLFSLFSLITPETQFQLPGQIENATFWNYFCKLYGGNCPTEGPPLTEEEERKFDELEKKYPGFNFSRENSPRVEFFVEDQTNAKNQYNFFKSISEVNQKIANSAKGLFLNPNVVFQDFPELDNVLSIFTLSFMFILADPYSSFYTGDPNLEVAAPSLSPIILTLIQRLGKYLEVNIKMGYKAYEGKQIIKGAYTNYDESFDRSIVEVLTSDGFQFQSFNLGFEQISDVVYIDVGPYESVYPLSILAHEMGHSIGELRDEYKNFISQKVLLDGKNPFPACCLKENGYTCVSSSQGHKGKCQGMPYETDWKTKDEISPGREPVRYGPLNSIMGIDGENSIYPIEAPCPLRNC